MDLTPRVENGARVPIRTDADIVYARQKARALAGQAGFTGIDLTLIATAISELARNIVRYAREGEISLSRLENGSVRGVLVVASDQGPGIPDVKRALELGYSTSGSLGLGLPGVQRLMDEFEIVSEAGKGTTVTVKKWLR